MRVMPTEWHVHLSEAAKLPSVNRDVALGEG